MLPPMTRTLTIALVALVIALSLATTAAAAPPKPSESPVRTLPLAKKVLSDGALTGATTPELLSYVDAALRRMLISEHEAALETAQDLHNLVVLASAVTLLQERGESSPQLRLQAAQVAYLLHAAGANYLTNPAARAAIDGMVEVAPDAATRELFEALVESMGQLQAVGRTWFPNALHAALSDAPKQPMLHGLRGLWLARERRYDDAVAALRTAIEQAPRVQYAYQLFLTLTEAGQLQAAAELSGDIRKAAPGLDGLMRQALRAREDREATVAFEKAAGKATAATLIEQLARYMRLRRHEAAEVLVKELIEEHGRELGALEAAAEALFTWRRYDRLQLVLEEAEQAGPLSVRLLEARMAAAADARMDALRGGPGHALGRGDLEADLVRYGALRGEEGRFVADSIRLFLLAGEAMVARAKGAKVSKELIARTRKLIEAGFAGRAGSGDMLRLALGATVALEGADASMELARKRLNELPEGEREAVALLLARIETGYGVRRRDVKLLETAWKRLEGLRRGGVLAKGPAGPLLQLAWVNAKVARATLRGPDEVKRVAGEVLPELLKLTDVFDESEEEGRLLAQAVSNGVGALAFVLGQNDLAREALTRSRRLDAAPGLARLAAAQSVLLGGDAAGAHGLMQDALPLAERPELTFAFRKWLALAANQAGSAHVAAEHMREMLALWPDAGIADVVGGASVAPLFFGDYNVHVLLEAGRPMRTVIETMPIVTFVPDFPHDRVEVRTLVERFGSAERGVK